MKIVSCPNCEMKYRLDPAKFSQPVLRIRCKKCNELFTVDLREEEAPSSVAPPSPPTQSPPSAPASGGGEAAAAGSGTTPATASTTAAGKPGGWRALVAHDNAETRATIAELLREGGFEVTEVDNGVDALMFIEQQRPNLAVLDVALPKIFGFEICEIVHRDPELAGVRTILVAAIYDHTRYKRSPHSLYGADDYIEKHHIPDSLVDKALRLVKGEDAPVREEETGRVTTPEEERREEALREELRRQEEAQLSAPPAGLSDEELERARRLARTIVSDIALYNQEKIEEGVRNGNLRELLADELEEGRQLLSERLHLDREQVEPYLEEALEQLIARKREEQQG